METTFLDLMRSEIAPHIMKFAWEDWTRPRIFQWHICVLATLSAEFRRWKAAGETMVQFNWVIDHLDDHGTLISEYPDSLASEEVSL